MKRELTPENIQELSENQIFVFGSNMNGNHAGGAARLAVEKFGAIMGQAEGIQGQSYAIPTLNKDMQKVTDEELIVSLRNFKHYADEHPELTFLLTKIGCGIAGFDTNYMAYMILRTELPSNVTFPVEFTRIKGYKGFNPDMTCRGFQYEQNKMFEQEGEVKACENGFHFCLHPLDVLGYYPPVGDNGINRYCRVEGDGNMSVDTDDTKVACSRIAIKTEIGIRGLVKAAISYVRERCTNEYNAEPGKPATAGDYGAATAGNRGAATAGNRGAATAGDRGAATAGNRGAATAGDYGAATAGYGGAATAGYGGAATAGDYGAATAGDYGAATARGKASSGLNGLSVVRGNNVKVRGGMGAILVIAEEDKETYDVVDWKAVVVDGKKVKADTWYMLVDGELKEVD
ncbi:A1S_2505 family phage non-structural protein [Phocaeicola faecalis]